MSIQKVTVPPSWSEAFEQDTSTTAGLTFGYKAGQALKAGTITDIALGTIALTANAINIVYIDYTSTPAIAVAVSTSKPVQEDVLFLFVVTTNGSGITDVIDLRNWTSAKAELNA